MAGARGSPRGTVPVGEAPNGDTGGGVSWRAADSVPAASSGGCCASRACKALMVSISDTGAGAIAAAWAGTSGWPAGAAVAGVDTR